MIKINKLNLKLLKFKFYNERGGGTWMSSL